MFKFCGGCGRPIEANEHGEYRFVINSGENYTIEDYYHEGYDGVMFRHFPGNYWKGIEGHRDEYLASLGIEID